MWHYSSYNITTIATLELRSHSLRVNLNSELISTIVIKRLERLFVFPITRLEQSRVDQSSSSLIEADKHCRAHSMGARADRWMEKNLGAFEHFIQLVMVATSWLLKRTNQATNRQVYTTIIGSQVRTFFLYHNHHHVSLVRSLVRWLNSCQNTLNFISEFRFHAFPCVL